MCGVLVCSSFSPGLRIAGSQALRSSGLRGDTPFSAPLGQSLLALPGHRGAQALSPGAICSVGSAVTWGRPACQLALGSSCCLASLSHRGRACHRFLPEPAGSGAGRAGSFTSSLRSGLPGRLGRLPLAPWIPALGGAGGALGGPCRFPPGAAPLRATGPGRPGPASRAHSPVSEVQVSFFP